MSTASEEVGNIARNYVQKTEQHKDDDQTQAARLIGLAADASLFQDVEGLAYASIVVREHTEHWKVRSSAFRLWLGYLYYQQYSEVANRNAMGLAIDQLEGKARYEGPTRQVFTRVAFLEEKLYLDLADDEWRVVEIAASGWRVCICSPVVFRRSKGMSALPIPQQGGHVDELRNFLNVTDEDFALVLAWLIFTYSPHGPFPLLVLHGEQGSAKSTTARVLRDLVDPNQVQLRTEPRDERDLAISGTNGWVQAFDNFSRLSNALSDALCRMATGGGFSTRRLYTDDEEVLLVYKRPVILNGIEELAIRGDLLDRSLVIYLPVISEEARKSEDQFWAAFELARPRLLGALLDVVTTALRELPSARARTSTLPRMADFSLFATAAEAVLGLEPGGFIELYAKNRTRSNELALDASPLATALGDLLARGSYDGSNRGLLEALDAAADDNATRSRGWPKTTAALTGALRRIAPNLRRSGIEIVRYRSSDSSGSRKVRVQYLDDRNATPSHVADNEPTAFVEDTTSCGESQPKHNRADCETNVWDLAARLGVEFNEEESA